MRLAFVQFGDFHAATTRLDDSGEETFHAQRHSVDYVHGLADRLEAVCVLAVNCPDAYGPLPARRVVAYGGPLPVGEAAARRRILAVLAEFRATHVVIRFPDAALIRACLDAGLGVLPCFADSFQPRPGLRWARDVLRFRSLGRLLNDPRIVAAGNHNIAAARDLVRIGVRPGRVIPWDWPRGPGPASLPPRAARGQGPFRLLYVGAVTRPKGVWDLVDAFAATPALAAAATLTVVGRGEVEALRAHVAAVGLGGVATIAGPAPFHEVAPLMRAHDALAVCSRRDYAEGLPGVIYQGLAARLPLVLSDHPMFTAYFRDPDDAVIVRAGAPAALAAGVLRLIGDAELHARLSARSVESFARIRHPTDWTELIGAWVEGGGRWTPWFDRAALPNWTRPAA